MDDKALRDMILDELDWEPSIDSSDIGVLVDDGVVTLTGHVPTYAQRRIAETVLMRLRGVRAVVQEIQVTPSGDADEEIARRAVQIVDWDVTVPREAVKVRVAKGLVTLSGEVEWEHQRRAAEDVVRRLKGVLAVVNQITLKPKVQPGDVRRKIEEALERYADVEAEGVRVDVADGTVILEGRVRAPFEREIVKNAAWSAPGVTAVEDRLSVAH
jgi:osmotically-inducible protein OsmY